MANEQNTGMAKRETAWRVFASEYNDSTFAFQNEDRTTPNFVLTPLGAKVNRLFFVGVITECENVGSEPEPLLRARVSDPTGVFYISAGRFQPEAAAVLAELDPPEMISVVGKARTYSPEEGGLYVSVRPEVINRVSPELREYWTLETCKLTKRRLEAMHEARQMHEPNIDELMALGYSRNLSEGILKAIEEYGEVDLQRYETVLLNVLSELVTRTAKPNPVGPPEEESVVPETETPVEDATEEPSTPPEDDLEEQLLGLIKSLYKDNVNGTMYQDLWEEASKLGVDRNQVEECITNLEDKGLIYEPSIGILKLVNP